MYREKKKGKYFFQKLILAQILFLL